MLEIGFPPPQMYTPILILDQTQTMAMAHPAHTHRCQVRNTNRANNHNKRSGFGIIYARILKFSIVILP